MIEADNDRRRFGRVSPVHRIRGRMGDTIVYVLDVSLGGVRIAHQELIAPIGRGGVLTFDWEGRRFRAQCEVRWTAVAKQARTQFEKTLHHSGLFITAKDENAEHILRDIVQHCVTRALDEQKANAQGIPATAAQSQQTGKADEFLCCELRQGKWTRTRTREGRQPLDGFTVAASEGEPKVNMLCRAYESGDAEGRRLIRTFAALSISKSEGIPTRRYAP